MAGGESDNFVIGIDGFEVKGTSEGGWVLLTSRDRRDAGFFAPPVRAFSSFSEVVSWLTEHDPERRWLGEDEDVD